MQLQKTFTDSKIISGISYNADTGSMLITYTTGKTYEYANVPYEVWNSALEAESIGTFVNNNIKGVFEYKLIN